VVNAAGPANAGRALTLQPFPSHFALNDVLAVHGEVGARFGFAHVFLTTVDGSVQEKRMPDRRVEASFELPKAGKYKLEVMGDGATGPVIVANVPIYVGAVENERPLVASGRAMSPAESEQRLFELLNQSRVAAGLRPLVADDPLRQIAFAHSTDMAEHDFFGHVSPTTGDPASRIERSGILVAKFGENLAQADTPEDAHDSLMSSPGHRAVMLGASYTHVGIAAVPSHQASAARNPGLQRVLGRQEAALDEHGDDLGGGFFGVAFVEGDDDVGGLGGFFARLLVARAVDAA
jgi:uncharacterized protein YkwD